MAASQHPEMYFAYVGIGQMSDTIESESFTENVMVFSSNTEVRIYADGHGI